jgi:N-acetylneuraminic acid mutarotase
MPVPDSDFATAVCDDKIYCISDGKTQVYDPANDTWENKTAMLGTGLPGSANVVDGKIYVMGGYPNSTLNQVYDPATDSWAVKAPIPTEYSGPSVVYNGKIYVFAEYSETGAFSFSLHSTTLIYDPDKNTWSQASHRHLSTRHMRVQLLVLWRGSGFMFLLAALIRFMIL